MDPGVVWCGWLALFLLYEIVAARSRASGDTLSEMVWYWFGVRTARRYAILRRLFLAAFLVALLAHLVLGASVLPVIVTGGLVAAVIVYAAFFERPMLLILLALPFLVGCPLDCKQLQTALDLARASGDATAISLAEKELAAAKCVVPTPPPPGTCPDGFPPGPDGCPKTCADLACRWGCDEQPSGAVCRPEPPPTECLPGVEWCDKLVPPAQCSSLSRPCKHNPTQDPGYCELAPTCTPGDPCSGVSCPDGQHCSVGMCVRNVPPPPSCLHIECPAGQHCVAGGCVPNTPPPADIYLDDAHLTVVEYPATSRETWQVALDALEAVRSTHPELFTDDLAGVRDLNLPGYGDDVDAVYSLMAARIRLSGRDAGQSLKRAEGKKSDCIFVARAVGSDLFEEDHVFEYGGGKSTTGPNMVKALYRYDLVVTTGACGPPVLPPLQSIDLKPEGKWMGGTPQFHGCDFPAPAENYCAKAGLGTMPNDPNVVRCDCPAWSEADPQQRMCREHQALLGDASWHTDGILERNPENHLQARCSDCSWIEVCSADGGKCTRVAQ